MLSIAWSCSFCTSQYKSLIQCYGWGSKCLNWLSGKYSTCLESPNSSCSYLSPQFYLRGWALHTTCGGKCLFSLFHTDHSIIVPNWRNPTQLQFQDLFNQSRTSFHDWGKTTAWNYLSQWVAWSAPQNSHCRYRLRASLRKK